MVEKGPRETMGAVYGNIKGLTQTDGGAEFCRGLYVRITYSNLTLTVQIKVGYILYV